MSSIDIIIISIIIIIIIIIIINERARDSNTNYRTMHKRTEYFPSTLC